MAMAFEGIRVIEVAQAAAAPMAGRFLADLGADVIHIENPTIGDAHRYFQARKGTPIKAGRGVPSHVNYNFELYNFNKRGMTLNLAAEKGQEIMYKLIKRSDVFTTNMRPFELEKFKLEYKDLSQVNPKLIYASLTGYGRVGPLKNAPGYDIVSYWARTGIPYMMDATGFRPAFGDSVGGLMLAYGITTALLVRERTGMGQEVDVSLYGVGIMQMSFDISGALIEKREFSDYRERSREDSLNPLAGAYLTKDGRTFFIMALQPDRYWPKICQAIEREELINDLRFNSFEARAKNRLELFKILDEAFATKTLDEWRLRFQDIPSGPVQYLLEVINDPQARANNFFVPLNHPVHGPIEVVATPIKYSKTPATVRSAAPELGQHTEEILLELGYTWEDIGKLREQQIV